MAGLLGGFEGEEGFFEGEAGGDEAVGFDLACGEGVNGVGEGSAAGADEEDFVDDEGGEVEVAAAGDGGLEDEAASGSDEAGGGLEAVGGAGAVDDEVVFGFDVEVGEVEALDASFFGEEEFFGVFSDDEDVSFFGGVGEDLYDEEAEGAVTEDEAAVAGFDGGLFDDLEGGGEGFDEDGLVVGERVRDGVDVSLGDDDLLGEGAVVVYDAEDGAVAAVVCEA